MLHLTVETFDYSSGFSIQFAVGVQMMFLRGQSTARTNRSTKVVVKTKAIARVKLLYLHDGDKNLFASE